MKIFQIVKAVGCYEDYHEYIVGTYLHKQKAESELTRLKAEVPNCDECPYSEVYQDKPIETNCPHHKPYNYCEDDDWEDDDDAYTCENCIDPYDAPSYRIEECEVDESYDDDIVITSWHFKTCEESNIPVNGLNVGDEYIEFNVIMNHKPHTVYCPVKDLISPICTERNNTNEI